MLRLHRLDSHILADRQMLVQHTHVRHCIQPDQSICVECDRECNVHLMDDFNYESFAAGHTFRYFGGLSRDHFPAIIKPPVPGCWNIVISPVKVGQLYTHRLSVVNSDPFRI